MGGSIPCPVVYDGSSLGAGQIGGDGIQHGARELILNLEEVAQFQFAIVALRPDLTAVGGVDQLRRDAEPSA